VKKPNIVFIMADDMGIGDVGCYNPDSKIPTPNMDKASEQGVRFTDAHSPSAVCTPTRYGVLTGRYCWRTSLKFGVLGGYSAPLVEPDRLTVAGMLKGTGYHTACIGKWHLGLGYRLKSNELLHESTDAAGEDLESEIDFDKPVTGGPVDVGFDYFFGTAGCPTCNAPYAFVENDRFVTIPNGYYDRACPIYPDFGIAV
jgi:arylsulfatase A